MKKFSSILLVAMVLMTVGSCTKIKESPEPSTIKSDNSGNNGGGGGGGNADVWLGLWELTKVQYDGVDQSIDSSFQVKLDAGGMSTWSWFRNGNIYNSENIAYTMTTSTTPQTINFNRAEGNKIIISKTATEIVWEYPILSNSVMARETLKKL